MQREAVILSASVYFEGRKCLLVLCLNAGGQPSDHHKQQARLVFALWGQLPCFYQTSSINPGVHFQSNRPLGLQRQHKLMIRGWEGLCRWAAWAMGLPGCQLAGQLTSEPIKSEKARAVEDIAAVCMLRAAVQKNEYKQNQMRSDDKRQATLSAAAHRITDIFHKQLICFQMRGCLSWYVRHERGWRTCMCEEVTGASHHTHFWCSFSLLWSSCWLQVFTGNLCHLLLKEAA